MTDMRATERLLEVIEELARRIEAGFGQSPSASVAAEFAEEITEVVQELRRRGDTLVRRDDLRRLAEPSPIGATWTPSDHEAYDRIQNAIGGKPTP